MSYTYSQLKTDVANRLHNKLGRITSIRDALNMGVRVAVKTPLKTLKRRYSEPIRLIDGVNDYYCPSDIMGAKVIDLRPISEGRALASGWRNTHPESFDRLRSTGQPILTVTSNGQQRMFKVSMELGDSHVTLSDMDSITDGGTWSAVGSASDLTTDTTTFLYGSGSVRFNLGIGTQDGISAALDSASDISDLIADGSAYVSASFPSISGLTGITVRLGSDASNYLECSATADISGNSLIAGFNMFRLKLSDGTETGSPDYENIDYAALLVDKNTVAMTGVRFDRLLVGAGAQHFLEYYSRFGWRSSAGTWKNASTDDTDILNAEEEEYDLVVEACVEQVALAAREYQDADRSALKLKEMKQEYRLSNPDQSIILSSDIYLVPSLNV